MEKKPEHYPTPTTLGVNKIIGVPNDNRVAAAHKAWETRRKNLDKQELQTGQNDRAE